MSDDGLAAGLRQLGLPADQQRTQRLLQYRDELARWNRVHNLSGIRDPARMVAVHLLDSLALAPLVRGDQLADLGSGAGLPGIPLAVLYPQWQVTLIEPRHKRALFLDHIVRTLGCANVIVERCRAEDLSASGAFTSVTARAFGTLAEVVASSAHLLGERGIILVAKGRSPAVEIAELPAGWDSEAVPLAVPGIDAQRHAVRLFRRQPVDRNRWAG